MNSLAPLPPSTTPSGVARPARHRGRQFASALGLLVGACALVYGVVWSYRFAESQLGPFAPLAAILVGGLLLAIVGPWLVVRYRRYLRAAIVRSLDWIGGRLAATGLPRRFARRYPRFSRFVVARFTPGSPTGLALTAWVIVAVALFEQVAELLIEVTSGSPVVALDHRITNLVATMRTGELDVVMYAMTQLGSFPLVGGLTVSSILIALPAGRVREAVLLFVVTPVSWIAAEGLQLLTARPRPPLADARIVATTFSFPSAHATLSVAFYGAVAYALLRNLRREWLKIVVGSLAALLALLAGVSRGYLGVDFPSDILAGWVLGGLCLALLAIADHIWQAKSRQRAARRGLPRAITIPRAVVLILLAVAYAAGSFVTAAQNVPPPPQVPPVTRVAVGTDSVPDVVQAQLQHYTEGLTGDRQEPVSLVFVGTQAQLQDAFRAAGWTEAQRFGFGSIGAGVEAVLAHQSDPSGPVTPSFLAQQPNTLAFSLPVGATFAERHHIRIWSTDVVTNAGEPVWLATASFDRGFELAPATFLPTHQIAPDIDAERTFVVSSLHAADTVAAQETIQLVPPEQGRNFDGDPFFTDGQAVILSLG